MMGQKAKAVIALLVFAGLYGFAYMALNNSDETPPIIWGPLGGLVHGDWSFPLPVYAVSFALMVLPFFKLNIWSILGACLGGSIWIISGSVIQGIGL